MNRMNGRKTSSFDKILARICANCLLCRRARKRQRGFAFRVVRRVEARWCPFCRAYERVFGRPAHAAPAPSAGGKPRA